MDISTQECNDNVVTTQSGIPIQLPIEAGNVLNIDKLTGMRYFGEYDDNLFFYPVDEEDENWREKIINHRKAGLGSVPYPDDDFGDRFYPDLDHIHVEDFNFLVNLAGRVEIDKSTSVDDVELSVETPDNQSVLSTTDVGIPIQVPLSPGCIVTIDDYKLRYYGEEKDSLFFFPVKHEGDNWRQKYRNHREIGLNSVMPIDEDGFSERYHPNLDNFYVGNFNLLLHESDNISVDSSG